MQYTLSEVGRSFDRFDPRQLSVGLPLLANNARPGDGIPHGPWEPEPGIYVHPSITKRNARHSAALAAATKADHLRALANTYPLGRTGDLAKSIAETLPGRSEIEETHPTASEHIGANVHWLVPSARIHVSSSGQRPSTVVWVTNDISWLFPDDPRLWQLLIDADRAGERVILLARKIAFSTFPLLKRVGAFGIQVHHLYVPDRSSDLGAVQRGLVAGPQAYGVSRVKEHVALKDNLVARLEEDLPPASADVIDDIRLAEQLGLASEALDRTSVLRDWSERCSLSMPPPWKAQITRYLKWNAMSPFMEDRPQQHFGMAPKEHA